MENKRIIYKDRSDNINIIIPSPECGLSLEEIANKDVPPELEYFIVDAESVPKDRYFREAWDYGDKLHVNMSKARDVHMKTIRHLRNKKLEELDKETMRGIDVQKEKKILRDIPQTFDLSNAGTPEELKAMLPKELS